MSEQKYTEADGTETLRTRSSPQERALADEWSERVYSGLLEAMVARCPEVAAMEETDLRNETMRQIARILQSMDALIPAELERPVLCQQVLARALGLGPLEELLKDESISEIMINRHDEVYVERDGRLQRHWLRYPSERAVLETIERIIAPLGRHIDAASPMVDARLQDGSRINAIIAPLALNGAALTIRKFSRRTLDAQALLAGEAFSTAMVAFLQACVVLRKNIIVSGGAGVGKTTLLNMLAGFIPVPERIITVEDAAELALQHRHLVRLEARPPNAEGRGGVAIRDLVRNALRMRPDRIIVGECRGAEAFDMLQAMNTGHEGSLTTLHANSPHDALLRLESLALMAESGLSLALIREQIRAALGLVVQLTRFPCGTRKITSIAVVSAQAPDQLKLRLREVFKFVSTGYAAPDQQEVRRIRGYFTACGYIPSFYPDLCLTGVPLPPGIFKPVPSGAAPRDG